MKKLLAILVLNLPLILQASVIDENSPWGVVAVWPEFTGVQNLTDAQRYAIYTKKLDSAQVGGFGGDRPNCLPGGEIVLDNQEFGTQYV